MAASVPYVRESPRVQTRRRVQPEVGGRKSGHGSGDAEAGLSVGTSAAALGAPPASAPPPTTFPAHAVSIKPASTRCMLTQRRQVVSRCKRFLTEKTMYRAKAQSSSTARPSSSMIFSSKGAAGGASAYPRLRLTVRDSLAECSPTLSSFPVRRSTKDAETV